MFQPHDVDVSAQMLHPLIDDAVLLRRDDSDETVLVVAASGHLSGSEARLAWPADASPAPTTFVVVHEIPRTSDGRPDPEWTEALAPDDRWYEFVPPATSTESTLARIIEEVLEVAPVGATDDFLDLGGHSLAAVAVADRIAADCGVELPDTDVFRAGTVRQLAALVDSAVAVGPST